MEYAWLCRLHPDGSHFVILSGQSARSVHDDVKSLINAIGTASSSAQKLSHVITTFLTISGTDNTLYILIDDTNQKVVGFTKVGRRHLFLWDQTGVQHEMNPLCLLDFFTFPECQRRGNGKKMINRMLQDQKLEMRQIPIDRPSSLCLSFMKKQFGLSDFYPQANKFVVFDEFWDDQPKPRSLLALERPKPKLVTPIPATRGLQKRKQQFNPITWAPLC
jgi:alpha-tubulin N-acetyltransferase 1